MAFLKRWFGRDRRKPAREQEHAHFGRVQFTRADGWRNGHFELWGFAEVELLVDAGPDGPTEAQERAFLRLQETRETLLPRCIEALERQRSDMQRPQGRWIVTGLTVPALDGSQRGKLWTMWFDAEGDRDFWYGVQTDDDWCTVVAFADD